MIQYFGKGVLIKMEDLENKIEEKIEEKLFTNEEVKKIKTKNCLNTILCSLLV